MNIYRPNDGCCSPCGNCQPCCPVPGPQGPRGPKDLRASLGLPGLQAQLARPVLPDPKDLRASLGLPGLQAQRVSLAVLPLWKWAMSPQEPPALTPK